MSGRTASPSVTSNNFAASAKRMLALLGHARATVSAVVVLALVSVGLTAAGPRILGRATDLIFAGVFGRQLTPGDTREQAGRVAS